MTWYMIYELSYGLPSRPRAFLKPCPAVPNIGWVLSPACASKQRALYEVRLESKLVSQLHTAVKDEDVNKLVHVLTAAAERGFDRLFAQALLKCEQLALNSNKRRIAEALRNAVKGVLSRTVMEKYDHATDDANTQKAAVQPDDDADSDSPAEGSGESRVSDALTLLYPNGVPIWVKYAMGTAPGASVAPRPSVAKAKRRAGWQPRTVYHSECPNAKLRKLSGQSSVADAARHVACDDTPKDAVYEDGDAQQRVATSSSDDAAVPAPKEAAAAAAEAHDAVHDAHADEEAAVHADDKVGVVAASPDSDAHAQANDADSDAHAQSNIVSTDPSPEAVQKRDAEHATAAASASVGESATAAASAPVDESAAAAVSTSMPHISATAAASASVDDDVAIPPGSKCSHCDGGSQLPDVHVAHINGKLYVMCDLCHALYDTLFAAKHVSCQKNARVAMQLSKMTMLTFTEERPDGDDT